MIQTVMYPVCLGAVALLASAVTGDGTTPVRPSAPTDVAVRATVDDDEHKTLTLRPTGAESESVIIEATNQRGELVRIVADSIRVADGEGEAQRDLFLDASGDVVMRWVEKPTPPVRMGVMTEPIPEALASHLKVDANACLMIAEVLDGLPASRAGIREYDIVMRIDDTAPVTTEHLRSVLSTKQPGDSVTLQLLRGGEPLTVELHPAAWTELAAESAENRSTLQVPVSGSFEFSPTSEDGSLYIVETPIFIGQEVRDRAATGVPMLSDLPIVVTASRPTKAAKFMVQHPGRADTKAIYGTTTMDVRGALLVEIAALRERLLRLESLVDQLPASVPAPAAGGTVREVEHPVVDDE